MLKENQELRIKMNIKKYFMFVLHQIRINDSKKDERLLFKYEYFCKTISHQIPFILLFLYQYV